MSSIDNRLKKLESEGPQRCDACLPWGDEPRISHHHSDGTSTRPDGPPERRESCGYEPVHICVCYTYEAAILLRRRQWRVGRKPAAPHSLTDT